jgi:hypothetical protein
MRPIVIRTRVPVKQASFSKGSPAWWPRRGPREPVETHRANRTFGQRHVGQRSSLAVPLQVTPSALAEDLAVAPIGRD